MRILGISALSHDAAISVVEDGRVLFAAHAERYSRRKNDAFLNQGIVEAALAYGRPDSIAWYERPFLKKTRQFAAGQFADAFSTKDIPSRYLKQFGLGHLPITYIPHHESHAAAGYFTSGFQDAVVLVIDAIGEWGTISIGEYQGTSLRWLRHALYPNSLGLLYSAFTQRCGLKPNEEEYILMGMAAFGQPIHRQRIVEDFIEELDQSALLRLKSNVHAGIGDWLPGAEKMDVAASIQAATEEILLKLVEMAGSLSGSKNLILSGGVALNCVANERIARFWSDRSGQSPSIWIMPNPGDAGCSLGAAAAMYGRPLAWKGPYLGTHIERNLDIDRVVTALEQGLVVGLANGRAEFGPRALGNRSLLSDPRGPETKDRVNRIKKRDMFRPFAPIVLADQAERFFDMPIPASPYMQYTAPCKDRDGFPAICHVDGSSRVQTLTETENPQLFAVINEFKRRTGCPMLLNTSLNIKGEPLVDSWQDAERFSRANAVEIF